MMGEGHTGFRKDIGEDMLVESDILERVMKNGKKKYPVERSFELSQKLVAKHCLIKPEKCFFGVANQVS